jgi:hypothetical protein
MMNVRLPREQVVIQEAIALLEQHMEPSKLVVLLSALQQGGGDYVATRETLFAGETVETLVEKIRQHQEE